jgi:TonB family protein
MHVLVAPSESKKNKHWNLVTIGIGFLLWGSPMFGLGIFFPLGVLALYRLNHTLRGIAFQILLIQIIAILFTFPLEFWSLFYDQSEVFQMQFLADHLNKVIIFWILFGIYVMFQEAQIFNKMADRGGHNRKGIFSILAGVFFSAVVLAGFITASVYLLSQPEIEPERAILQFLRGDTLLYFWLVSLHTGTVLAGRRRNRIMGIFRKAFASLYIHTRLTKPTNLQSNSFTKKAKYAKYRDYILPGWGMIYLRRYWIGFPILFIYLLLILFSVTSILYYFDYSVGTKFLGLFQLKTGIPDKEFIKFTSNVIVPIVMIVLLFSTYVLSQIVLSSALKKDDEPEEQRGLHSGFKNNLALSFLAHLTIVAIILIIPVSIQRASSSKKRDMSKDHFQPEKMEFYFIDPEIPDEVKDLNGGVISGTETPSQNDGIKIPDEPTSDEGKVKGYVKRIKGKKLPKTYSNYISARMRGPETFMDYWKRAPHPYSCVVAYTITTEGEITDVYIVESSNYPDQDQLTIDLVESMSPVMPPPGVKGDVRVTELFWNGSIDPDSMPTPLQKEMVLMFDGRYMEEEP